MTPFYERDGITIYCGEASEVLSQFELGSIDLTVTSPPYDNLRTYNGYTFDFEAIAGQLWRVTAVGGVVVWVVGDATVDGSETGTSFRQALGFMGLGFKLHDTMIWDKEEYAFPNSTRYENVFEFMFVFSKGQPKAFNPIQRKNIKSLGRIRIGTDRQTDGTTKHCEPRPVKETSNLHNVWRLTAHKSRLMDAHPAPFPEALARDHIISWSNPGDLVCDPMLGSGTTAKMAQQLDRRFVGCDISEDYCKIAVDRLRQPSFFSLPNREPVVQPKQVSLF